MRKLWSILLLLAFVLPFAAPSLAQDAGLPACCRRSGKHHCMGTSGAGMQESGATRWDAPLQRCPYAPSSLVSVPLNTMGAPVAAALLSEVAGSSHGVAQTESKWRIARDRSRQKRGPPVHLLS